MKNYKELSEELKGLKTERTRLEQKIVSGGEKIFETIRHPAPIIKEAVASLVSDSTFITNLVSLGISFITRKMSGKSWSRHTSTENTGQAGSHKEDPIAVKIMDFVSNLLNKNKRADTQEP